MRRDVHLPDLLLTIAKIPILPLEQFLATRYNKIG